MKNTDVIIDVALLDTHTVGPVSPRVVARKPCYRVLFGTGEVVEGVLKEDGSISSLFGEAPRFRATIIPESGGEVHIDHEVAWMD